MPFFLFVFRLLFLMFLTAVCIYPQNILSQDKSLSIEKIMRDPVWIGSSPKSINWSENSKKVFFMWNQNNDPGDSLYVYSLENGQLRKTKSADRSEILPSGSENYNKTLRVYENGGDLYLLDMKSKKSRQVTDTLEPESSPAFLTCGNRFSFIKENNIFIANLDTLGLSQLTAFRKGAKITTTVDASQQEKWLLSQERRLIKVFGNKKENISAETKKGSSAVSELPIQIYTGNSDVKNLKVSPDGRYVSFICEIKPENSFETVVPSYLIETGFVGELKARPKVGSPQSRYRLGICDTVTGSVVYADISKIQGISDVPEYSFEKAVGLSCVDGKNIRSVIYYGPYWSSDGKYPVIVMRTLDNKDKWIALIDPLSGSLKIINHEHDDAWIGVPWWIELEENVKWMPCNKKIWYLSEETGFNHIYTIDVSTGKKEQITSGDYEIFDPFLSKDGKFWYYISNEKDNGERHFYRMDVKTGKKEIIISLPGSNQIFMSPDEKNIAVLNSYTNIPWELYIAENKPGTIPKKITDSASDEFKSYKWRDPEIIEIKATDGTIVKARLYKPSGKDRNGAGVIFVHGAGYVQDAHRWWSNYFREFMFNNLLADHGYTVLDIDYRGSAGYGHSFGTAIYRNMGGKDLDDQVDGADYMIKNCGVMPGRIGIYGGSYGGFITLMAMFKRPDVFTAGAALRPVTDWAHYEHPYTSSILNVPATDSLAYIKSSPIYYAEGLKGSLLICHGMVDTNVQFQDVVRLSQRLIELGKDNWEVAMYPVENHGFVQPSSWTDEYKRILRLFENELLRNNNQ